MIGFLFYFGKPLDCMSFGRARPVIREVLWLWKFLKRRKFLHIQDEAGRGRTNAPAATCIYEFLDYEPAAMPPRCATVSRRYL